jgi:hypothetical protein
MTRVYKQTPDGKVVNANPRKKPQWSSKAPQHEGYYWMRFRFAEPFRDENPLVAHVELDPTDGEWVTDVFYTGNVHKYDGSSGMEWWPARIRRPK